MKIKVQTYKLLYLKVRRRRRIRKPGRGVGVTTIGRD